MRDDGWKLQIVKRRQRAFKIPGLTWIVEQSFAWLGRNRRFSKDYEYAVQTSETMIDIATIRIMLNRLAPAARSLGVRLRSLRFVQDESLGRLSGHPCNRMIQRFR
jgi:hypothetical protein